MVLGPRHVHQQKRPLANGPNSLRGRTSCKSHPGSMHCHHRAQDSEGNTPPGTAEAGDRAEFPSWPERLETDARVWTEALLPQLCGYTAVRLAALTLQTP